jgi:hypothetical protein
MSFNLKECGWGELKRERETRRSQVAGRAKWLVSPAPLGELGWVDWPRKGCWPPKGKGAVASSAAQGFCGRCTQDRGGGFEFRRFRFLSLEGSRGYARMGEDEDEDVDVNVTEGICLD